MKELALTRMRAESDGVTPVGIERIQDKTRWAKAAIEAGTAGCGHCKATNHSEIFAANFILGLACINPFV